MKTDYGTKRWEDLNKISQPYQQKVTCRVLVYFSNDTEIIKNSFSANTLTHQAFQQPTDL